MKAYPSITTKIDFTKKFYVFDKLDGSNIRAEWSPKTGFYKFGSRTQLLVPDQAVLWPSIELIKDKFEAFLAEKFKKAKFERAVCFFEYCGPHSFAGSHTDPVDQMDAKIIDIDAYKKGILPPSQFLEITEGRDIPTLLHTGRIDEEFFQSVRSSTLPGMTFEGVVGKTDEKRVEMFKIKSNGWLNRLKEYCHGDEQMFNRLK